MIKFVAGGVIYDGFDDQFVADVQQVFRRSLFDVAIDEGRFRIFINDWLVAHLRNSGDAGSLFYRCAAERLTIKTSVPWIPTKRFVRDFAVIQMYSDRPHFPLGSIQ